MSHPHGMQVRRYHEGDAPALCQLFFNTVRTVNRADYSPEQVIAWAPRIPDPEAWHRRMSRRATFVAEDPTGLLGFIELEGHGVVDMLYCRNDVIRRGVGSALYRAAEGQARQWGVTRLTTHASVTARPFFERMGFAVVEARVVERMHAGLRNFEMEKVLQVDRPPTRRGSISRWIAKLRSLRPRWMS